MTTGIVTGAASGIGRALAVALADEGHRLHLVDMVPADGLATQLGARHHRVDVADAEGLQRLAHALDRIDVVCLNAGILGQAMGAPWEASPEEWQRVLGVNLLGVVNGLRAFVPLLRAGGAGGRVVITASVAGLVTFPGGGAYAASKHAVVAVAEQASLILRPEGITVTVACPALVRSGMSEAGEDPAEVARAMLAASARGDFLVVPQEWRAAVRTRAEHHVGGSPPDLPQPAADEPRPSVKES